MNDSAGVDASGDADWQNPRMAEHHVQQTISTRAIVLTCMECDWQVTVGVRDGLLSYDQLQASAPIAVMARWAHVDPSLLQPADGEPVERSFLRRMREYFTRGTPP